MHNASFVHVHRSRKSLRKYSGATSESRQDKYSETQHWDDELHGEQVVFDPTFEINEDLVPWVMNPEKWEEKYGLY